jgi:hypothetical protein
VVRLVPGKQNMIRWNMADARGMILWIVNIVVICASLRGPYHTLVPLYAQTTKMSLLVPR